MRKESPLYRLVYTVALLAASAAVAFTYVFNVYGALAEYVSTNLLHYPTIGFSGYALIAAVKFTAYIAMVIIALVFALLLNLPTLIHRLRQKTMKTQVKKPWYGWLAISLAAALLFSMFFYNWGPHFTPYWLGLIFFFMPVLWEYALGLNKPELNSVTAASRQVLSGMVESNQTV